MEGSGEISCWLCVLAGNQREGHYRVKLEPILDGCYNLLHWLNSTAKYMDFVHTVKTWSGRCKRKMLPIIKVLAEAQNGFLGVISVHKHFSRFVCQIDAHSRYLQVHCILWNGSLSSWCSFIGKLIESVLDGVLTQEIVLRGWSHISDGKLCIFFIGEVQRWENSTACDVVVAIHWSVIVIIQGACVRLKWRVWLWEGGRRGEGRVGELRDGAGKRLQSVDNACRSLTM